MTPSAIKKARADTLDARKEELLELADYWGRHLKLLASRHKRYLAEIDRINRELATRRVLPK